MTERPVFSVGQRPLQDPRSQCFLSSLLKVMSKSTLPHRAPYLWQDKRLRAPDKPSRRGRQTQMGLLIKAEHFEVCRGLGVWPDVTVFSTTESSYISERSCRATEVGEGGFIGEKKKRPGDRRSWRHTQTQMHSAQVG
jgi:hypothetical protein